MVPIIVLTFHSRDSFLAEIFSIYLRFFKDKAEKNFCEVGLEPAKLKLVFLIETHYFFACKAFSIILLA